MLRKFTLLVVSFTVVMAMCLVSFASEQGEKDVAYFEIPVSLLKDVSVNHEQGSIGFTLNNTEYFYYVQAEEAWERIEATSKLLADIRNASTLQIKSETYGLHRKITNLLLFYGDRVIPDNLKEIPSKEKVD